LLETEVGWRTPPPASFSISGPASADLWNILRNDEYQKDRRTTAAFAIYSEIHTAFDISSQGTVFLPVPIGGHRGSHLPPPASRLISAITPRTGAWPRAYLTYRDTGTVWEAEIEIGLPDQGGHRNGPAGHELLPQQRPFMRVFPTLAAFA
jgi:hypothetical protein